MVAIYVYLVFSKVENQRYLKKQDEWLNEKIPVIEKYLIMGELSTSFFPKKEYEFEALENTFSNYISILKFEDDFDPIRPIVNKYFIPRYKEKLNNGRWSDRMNALFFINQFQIKLMKQDLIDHLSSKICSNEEKIEIFLILAKFNDQTVLELLKKDQRIPPFFLTELMHQLIHIDNVDQYLDKFDQLPNYFQYPILDVIRIKHLRTENTHNLLENLIQSNDRELRIRTLKTIASLGYISSTNLVLEIIENIKSNNEWDNPGNTGEKLMFARLMGEIRHQEFIPYLIELIADKAYIVRSEAAKSIRKYKQGEDVLLMIIADHPDSYARNISQEWLERALEHD